MSTKQGLMCLAFLLTLLRIPVRLEPIHLDRNKHNLPEVWLVPNQERENNTMTHFIDLFNYN